MKMLLSVTFSVLCVVTLAAQQAPAVPAAPAQAPKSISFAEANFKQYVAIRDEMTRLVDKMPAEFYSFQPTPEIKTFAGSVAHIAQSNIGQCGYMVDGRKMDAASQTIEKTMTAKADLVKTIAAGFALCDQFFEHTKTNDAYAARQYNSFMMENGQRVPVSIDYGSLVTSLIGHNNEMYGYMSVYLRLKGIVPPTSEPRK